MSQRAIGKVSGKKYSFILKKWCNIFTERQTSRQTETDSLIWLTSWSEVKILRYDWLREIWAITWEPEISLTYNFPRALKGHKYFQFRQFSNKTNDVVSLKSSKILFLWHFWPFLGAFYSMKTFSKKLNSVTSEPI